MTDLNAQIFFGTQENSDVLKITGCLRFNQCAPLDNFLKKTLQKKLAHPLLVDLSQTELLDSTALGLLAQIAMQYERVNHQQPELYCPENDLNKVLLSMSLEQLFHFVSKAPLAQNLPELSVKSDALQTQTQRVLSAHQTLMGLSDNNKKEFQSVVDMLTNSLTPK